MQTINEYNMSRLSLKRLECKIEEKLIIMNTNTTIQILQDLKKYSWKYILNILNNNKNSRSYNIFRSYIFLRSGFPLDLYESSFMVSSTKKKVDFTLIEFINELLSRTIKFYHDIKKLSTRDQYNNIEMICGGILENMKRFYQNIKIYVNHFNHFNHRGLNLRATPRGIPLGNSLKRSIDINESVTKKRKLNNINSGKHSIPQADCDISIIHSDRIDIKKIERLHIINNELFFYEEYIDAKQLLEHKNDPNMNIIKFVKIDEQSKKLSICEILVEHHLLTELKKVLLITNMKQYIYINNIDYITIKNEPYTYDNHIIFFSTFRSGYDNVDQIDECLICMP